MARGKAATKTAPAPEPEVEETEGTPRGAGEMHELFSEFLKEEYGADVSPEAIFLVTSKRTAFRRSDAYLDFAEKQDEERAKAAEEKEARKAARADKTEEPEEEAAETTPTRGRRAKKTPEADTAEESGVTPIRGRRRGKAAPAPTTAPADDTADEAQAATTPAKTRRRRSAPASF